MAQLKAGTRLKSAVCDTQVMVIAAPEGEPALSCGGAPMLDLAQESPEGVAIDPDAKQGSLLGKRYVNEAGDLEVLCTKPGEGTLALGGEVLRPKEAKALPSSD